MIVNVYGNKDDLYDGYNDDEFKEYLLNENKIEAGSYDTRTFSENFDDCCYKHLNCYKVTLAVKQIAAGMLIGFVVSVMTSVVAWGSGIALLASDGGDSKMHALGITITSIGAIIICVGTLLGAIIGGLLYVTDLPD